MNLIKNVFKYTIICFILLVIVALIIPEEWLETDEDNITLVQADNEEDIADKMIKYFDIEYPTKPITEMNDVEYLEMVYEPMITSAGNAVDTIKNNYWKPTYVNGLMEYEDAKDILDDAIEYLDNIEHNILQIPTSQFSKKAQKKADDLKEVLAEVVIEQRDLIKVSKKMLEEDKYTLKEFSDQLKKKGGEDLNKLVNKDLKKANDKLNDLVYDR